MLLWNQYTELVCISANPGSGSLRMALVFCWAAKCAVYGAAVSVGSSARKTLSGC